MKKFLILILLAIIFTSVLFSCEIKNNPAANPASDFEYTIDGDNVTITKFIGTSEELIIPDKIDGKSVTTIGRMAFMYNNFTKIVIPDSVTTIEDHAFAYSVLLTTVTLSKNITTIDYSIFRDCGSLSSIIIPEGVTAINGIAFRGCVSLADLSIPDSVIFIADEAFAQCDLITGETREKILKINPKAFDDTL